MVEAGFLFMYATGRLPYIADSEAFSSWSNAARMIGWSLGVPLFREVHFYAAHRLIHVRFVYRFVHSLHHRNTDIEPFSGLSMHPIEHLYYFTSYAPALYFLMSPFHMLWFGYHLLISPAAAHSGFEVRLS